MAKAKEIGMTPADALNAIENSNQIWLGIKLNGVEVDYMKWRDKAEAIRRRLRLMVNEVAKAGPEARCNAVLHSISGESILIVGDRKPD